MENNEMPKFCRPVSSLMDTISTLGAELNSDIFYFLFKDFGLELWNEYSVTYQKSLLIFWRSLDSHNRAKFAQYLEGITDKFDVENSMSWNDLKLLSKTPNNLLQTKVRAMNVESYGLNLDENAVCKYIVKNKKLF